MKTPFVFFLPLLIIFVESNSGMNGQHNSHPSAIELRELTNKWRKDVQDFQNVDKRRTAVAGFVELSSELSNLVSILNSRLLDPDPEIRLKAAQGLANVGPSANSAVINLVDLLKKDKSPEIRMAAITTLGRILWEGCNPRQAKHVLPT